MMDKRVLFVSSYFPSNLRTLVHGTFKRMEMFIDALKAVARLDMLFYVRPDQDISPPAVAALEQTFSQHWKADIRLFLCPRFEEKAPISKWQRYGSSFFSLFRQPGYAYTSGPEQVQALEACLQRQPEAIFAHRLSSMCPLLLTRQQKELPPIFFDLDDIEHVSLVRSIRQQTNWRSQLVSSLRVPALWWGERQAICLAQKTFVCSELDRRYLTRYWRLPGVVTVPNAIAIPALQTCTTEPILLFLGSYTYKPNVAAAEYLIRQIWPRVYQEMPSARLLIAGAPPERVPSYARGVPGVEFTGFVEDLEALYRRARVVCAPILSGAGTRIKLIEAAAHGKAIVTTPVGAEGLEMEDGQELLLCEEPSSFAQACLALLRDPGRCAQLGKAARERVRQLYDRNRVIALIGQHLQNGSVR